MSNLNAVVAIAAGDSHSLALKEDGTVWAWGSNRYGQLGNSASGLNGFSNDPDAGEQPERRGGDCRRRFLQLGAEERRHSLGVGERYANSVPVAGGNLTDVVAIAAGYGHSLALKSDGTVWAWGNNYDGQLGNGTNTDSDCPSQMSNLTGVVAISAGDGHSLALKSGGAVWASGCQLPESGCRGVRIQHVPVWVGNLSAAAIAAGYYHSLAVIRGGIPGLTLGTKAINFGNQRVGATDPARAISVTNSGDQPLEIKAVTLLGINAGEFRITSDTCTGAILPAGGSCGINVKFVPLSRANRSAAFLITSNAPRSPHLVTLRGTASAAHPPPACSSTASGTWTSTATASGSRAWTGGPVSVGRERRRLLGDWNGDGKTEIGVFNEGSWYLDYNGNGVWDGFATTEASAFGWPGVTPVVGDWNGDGKDRDRRLQRRWLVPGLQWQRRCGTAAGGQGVRLRLGRRDAAGRRLERRRQDEGRRLQRRLLVPGLQRQRRLGRRRHRQGLRLRLAGRDADGRRLERRRQDRRSACSKTAGGTWT